MTERMIAAPPEPPPDSLVLRNGSVWKRSWSDADRRWYRLSPGASNDWHDWADIAAEARLLVPLDQVIDTYEEWAPAADDGEETRGFVAYLRDILGVGDLAGAA